MEKFKELRAMHHRLIEEYEEQYGPWMPTSNSVEGDRWSWVDGPWPWEGKGGQ